MCRKLFGRGNTKVEPYSLAFTNKFTDKHFLQRIKVSLHSCLILQRVSESYYIYHAKVVFERCKESKSCNTVFFGAGGFSWASGCFT